MHTELHEDLRDTAQGRRAQQILRNCVHCGFCNATCPTYQITGDELDGPRGRIYLIKEVLESGSGNPTAQRHLSCLRNHLPQRRRLWRAAGDRQEYCRSIPAPELVCPRGTSLVDVGGTEPPPISGLGTIWRLVSLDVARPPTQRASESHTLQADRPQESRAPRASTAGVRAAGGNTPGQRITYRTARCPGF